MLQGLTEPLLAPLNIASADWRKAVLANHYRIISNRKPYNLNNEYLYSVFSNLDQYGFSEIEPSLLCVPLKDEIIISTIRDRLSQSTVMELESVNSDSFDLKSDTKHAVLDFIKEAGLVDLAKCYFSEEIIHYITQI